MKDIFETRSGDAMRLPYNPEIMGKCQNRISTSSLPDEVAIFKKGGDVSFERCQSSPIDINGLRIRLNRRSSMCSLNPIALDRTAPAITPPGNSTLSARKKETFGSRHSTSEKIRATFQRRAVHVGSIFAGGLITLSASAAPTEALAESELALYGTLDMGIAWTRESGNSTAKGLISGGQTDSLWGVRGRKTIGNGNYALFALEGGLDLANGRADDPDRLFNYEAWVGLGNEALGELRLGRQHTVGQMFVSEIEVGSWKDFGMGALMRASDNYQVSNQVSWLSPTWEGTSVGASYSFDASEQSDSGPRNRLFSLAGRYENGPWLLATSFEKISPISVLGSDRYSPSSWQLAASYNLTAARIAAAVSTQRNGFVGRNGGDASEELGDLGLQGLGPLEFIQGGRLDVLYVGTAIPLGQGELQLQWSQARPDWVWQETGARAERSEVMSIGYVHTLTQSTSVYAFAAHGRSYVMDAIVSAEEPSVRRVALGVTHQF